MWRRSSRISWFAMPLQSVTIICEAFILHHKASVRAISRRLECFLLLQFAQDPLSLVLSLSAYPGLKMAECLDQLPERVCIKLSGSRKSTSTNWHRLLGDTLFQTWDISPEVLNMKREKLVTLWPHGAINGSDLLWFPNSLFIRHSATEEDSHSSHLSFDNKQLVVYQRRDAPQK